MALILNKLICQRSLVALPFRKFLQGTTRLPLVSLEFRGLKTTSIGFKDKKTKTPAKQWSFVSNQVMPSTSDKLKISEIIEYFKNPSYVYNYEFKCIDLYRIKTKSYAHWTNSRLNR